jgi:hypothetical protein
VLVGLPQVDGGLAIIVYLFCFYLFLFIIVYFYNTHQVLVGLPQGVGGLAIFFPVFFSFITRTRCLQGSPEGMEALLFDFHLFYLYFILFCLFYFHNTHQVIKSLPQCVGGLTTYFILF